MRKPKTFLDPIKLRNARKNAGVSRAEMGVFLDVGLTQIGNIENGYNSLDAEKLYIWAKVCHVEIADLYSHKIIVRTPKKDCITP